MTPEHIHDALTLLPADLIAEADRKRRGKPKLLRWKRFAAMAACFALVLGCGWYSLLLFGAKGGARPEQAAAEVPAAAAPMLPEEYALDEQQKNSPVEVLPESSQEYSTGSVCRLPTAPAMESDTTAGSANDDSLCIDHSHSPGEPAEAEGSGGWCGNMTATICLDGEDYVLHGTDAVILTDLLYRLDYRPENLCRCAAEFSADTEMGQGYAISLENYFVRHDQGQAALTEEQAETLRQLLCKLEQE